MFQSAKCSKPWLRAAALLVAYALVFRLALPVGMPAAADPLGDPHVLCLTASSPAPIDGPVAPVSDHGACDLCCLSAGAPALAAPSLEFTVAAPADAIRPILLAAGPDIRGPPAAEAWGVPRAQRGPPAIQ